FLRHARASGARGRYGGLARSHLRDSQAALWTWMAAGWTDARRVDEGSQADAAGSRRAEDAPDLSLLAPFDCNDMVVDARGRAYVGNFGFDLHGNPQPRATTLVMVSPDAVARVVAEDLMFPNGMVITPDGKTLIVGETFAARLTAFDIAAGVLVLERGSASFAVDLPPALVA